MMKVIKGKRKTAQKTVIYGPEGIGKSSLAALWPVPLFIDVEKGTNHLEIDRVMPETWVEAMTVIEELIDAPGPYKSIVIDSADWLDKLCSEYICRKFKKRGIEAFGFGKGYIYQLEAFASFLSRLDQLVAEGIQVVITAHSQLAKMELPDSDGSFDYYSLKCSKKVTPVIKEWTDALLFLNYSVIVETTEMGKTKARGGKKRKIHTQHTASYDAKNRWGLPAEVEVGDLGDPLPKEIQDEIGAPVSVEPKETPEQALMAFAKEQGFEIALLKDYLKTKGVKRLSKKVILNLIDNVGQLKEDMDAKKAGLTK